jgi:topoisomerase IV subunit B
VVNALSDHMRVEVARNRELWAQEFSRGVPQGPVAKVGPAPNRRGTTVTFHPDAEIFGHAPLPPARLFRMARSKAYLFSGWRSAGNAPLLADGDTPQEASFRFPGGLADYLAEQLGAPPAYRPALRRQGGVSPRSSACRAGGMGDRLDAGARRLRAELLQHRAHARGRHP